MGASTQTSTSQQHSETQPWAPAIPGLQQAIGDATSLYNSGAGTGIYGGPRVAQLGDDALSGLQSIRDQTASDNAGAQGTSFLQNTMGSGGISPTTAAGLSMLSNVPNADTSKLSSLADWVGSGTNPINQVANQFMSGARDLTTIPQLDQLYAKSQAPSSAETNLSGMAAGADLDPTKNAIFQNLVKTSSDNALQAQKEAFAASGRYGTGAFAGAANKAVNDTDTALYANQYNQNVANQISANSMIDSARQAASSLGLGITNAKSGVESTNNQQRLAGAGLGVQQEGMQSNVLGQVLGGDQFNSGLGVQKAQGFINAGQTGQAQAISAASALPALDALRYSPAQQLLGVGSILQGQDQANIGAAQQVFDEQNNMPWQNLDRYAGLMGGMAGLGGTTDSTGRTQTQTSQSLGSTLIGGLSSGLGLLGMTGAFGPVGAATGGIGGLSAASGAGGYLTPYLRSAASSIFGR